MVCRVHQLFRPRSHRTSVLLAERATIHFHLRHADIQPFLYIIWEGFPRLPGGRGFASPCSSTSSTWGSAIPPAAFAHSTLDPASHPMKYRGTEEVEPVLDAQVLKRLTSLLMKSLIGHNGDFDGRCVKREFPIWSWTITGMQNSVERSERGRR